MRMAGGDQFFNALNKGMKGVRSNNTNVDRFLKSSNASADLSEDNRSPSGRTLNKRAYSLLNKDRFFKSSNASADLSEDNRSPSGRDLNKRADSSFNEDKYLQSPDSSFDADKYLQSPDNSFDADKYLQNPDSSFDADKYLQNPDSSFDADKYLQSPDSSFDADKYLQSPPRPQSTIGPVDLDKFIQNPAPYKAYTPSAREYTPRISLDKDAAAERFATLNTQNQNYKATVGANDAEGSLQRAKNHKANTDAILGDNNYIEQGLNVSNAFINNGREQKPLDIEALYREVKRSPLVSRARAEYQGLLLYGDRYRHARERQPDWQSPQPLGPVERPDLGGIADNYLDRIDGLSI